MTGVVMIKPPGWMSEPDTTRLFNALKEGGHTVRFVGGCVRDTVADRPVSDIDVATDAEPDRVLEVLGAAMIRAVPTGIEHGTITAIPESRPYEITTLRKDVETDGRRAKVQFTKDWVEDASRRDFTFNALSADPDGKVYDYFDGLEDLKAGRVRFIGEALERVAEDYLRVLRFFRFHAHYAKTDPDPDSYAACRAAATHVETLPGERIWAEMSRTLTAPVPGPVFQMMEDIGLLRLLLPVGRSVKRMEALAALETMVSFNPDPIRRLTALIQPNRSEASQIAARLRLSRDETHRLDDLNASRGESGAAMNELALRRALYALGRDQFRDLILLDWADQIAMNATEAAQSVEGWKETWDTASSWEAPEFPLVGKDVLEMGVEEGPKVGEILDDLEEWWVEQAFRPDREACLDRLRLAARRR
ncbi:MAG: CCA tRNA nucleotidyltransferase [Alphaproteobacteria bacterium]